MAQFNVHEWNYKRRLEEASNLDRFSPGAIAADQVAADKKADAVTALVDAIELAKNTGAINKAQELILDQVAASLIKKMAGERGDLD